MSRCCRTSSPPAHPSRWSPRSRSHEPPRHALIVVDVQQAFNDPSWGERNNPACEANIAALIEHWRTHDRPLVFVRHDSDEPGSTLAPQHPGNAFKDIVTGEPDLLVSKTVNSSFYGEPDLQAWSSAQPLRSLGFGSLTIFDASSA